MSVAPKSCLPAPVRLALLVSLTSLALPVFAHSGLPMEEGISASLDLAVSWRSKNQLSDADIHNQVVWQMPGLLMGGHASAYQQNSTLDQASLRMQYLSADRSYAMVKVGSHGDSEVSLENAMAGQSWEWAGQSLSAEAGRMTAFFSPFNHQHPADAAFSLTPLAYSGLLGGHVEDVGVRMSVGEALHGLSAGIEHYQGSRFPAADSGGLSGLFVRHAGVLEQLDWQLQGWLLDASANNRQDDRSASSHSHSASSSTAFSGYFDGDTRVAGLFGDIGYRWANNWRLGLVAEYMSSQVNGQVTDSAATRVIQLDGDYQSLLLEPGLTLGAQRLAVRYEVLHIINRLTGTAVDTLADEAGLINDGHNPQRLAAVWHWQYNGHTGVRLEWMSDQSMPDRQPVVMTAGVIWKGELL